MLPSEIEVEQRQTEVRVIVRDLDHEPQVGANHEGARFLVALFDFGGEFDLLLGVSSGICPISRR